MEAFDVLGDPVRRRMLELLADRERTAGAVTATIQAERGIRQPAVSQQLRVLRERWCQANIAAGAPAAEAEAQAERTTAAYTGAP